MIETIIALGVVLFVLLYISFNLEKEHFILQLFLLFISLFVLILIPKAALDMGNDCETVLNSTSEIYEYGNNFSGYHWDYDAGTAPDGPQLDAYLFHREISYTYTENCLGNNATETTFYKLVMWIVRIISTYIVFYFLFSVFFWLGKNGKNKSK